MRLEYKGTLLEQILELPDNVEFIYLDNREFYEALSEAEFTKILANSAESWFTVKNKDFVVYLEDY